MPRPLGHQAKFYIFAYSRMGRSNWRRPLKSAFAFSSPVVRACMYVWRVGGWSMYKRTQCLCVRLQCSSRVVLLLANVNHPARPYRRIAGALARTPAPMTSLHACRADFCSFVRAAHASSRSQQVRTCEHACGRANEPRASR